MVATSIAVWGIGFLAIIVLAIVVHQVVVRAADHRWRHPWWAVLGTIAASYGILTLIDHSLEAPRATEELNTQVALPATYSSDTSELVLNEDGSATLHNVVLADDVAQNGAGRWRLSGEPVPTSGDAQWSMASNGAVRIDANGKVAQLFPDSRLVLGYGWGKGYLLTSRDVPFATVYWAASAR